MYLVVLSINALGKPKALVFAANDHSSISPKSPKSSWKHQGSFVPKFNIVHCVGHSKSQAALPPHRRWENTLQTANDWEQGGWRRCSHRPRSVDQVEGWLNTPFCKQTTNNKNKQHMHVLGVVRHAVTTAVPFPLSTDAAVEHTGSQRSAPVNGAFRTRWQAR